MFENIDCTTKFDKNIVLLEDVKNFNHNVLPADCPGHIDYMFPPIFINPYPDFRKLEITTLENVLATNVTLTGKPYKLSVRYFEQIWHNISAGLDEAGAVSGQAFTKAFTTVIKLDFGINKDGSKEVFYGVYFNGENAYLVFNPTEQFLKDLENEDLKNKANANNYY